MNFYILSFSILQLIFYLITPCYQQERKLMQIPLASKTISVSGFSSGGGMAHQFYLAHSNIMSGVAIYSGLLYQCGMDAFLEIGQMIACITINFDFERVNEKIRKLSSQGLLDPLDNMGTRLHYVSHGRNDKLINPEMGDLLVRFFDQYSGNVRFVPTEAAHGFPTEKCSKGYPCSQSFPPSATACVICNFSAAYDGLNYIQGGNLKRPTDEIFEQCNPSDSMVKGLMSFNQSEFFNRNDKRINMADIAYIFIPTGCRANSSQCTLHVNIHGCGQIASSPLVGTQYIKCSGFLGIAEANNIIVLFPQAKFGLTSASAVLQCWDFVGYSGRDFGTKNGSQVMAFRKMVDRILDG